MATLQNELEFAQLPANTVLLMNPQQLFRNSGIAATHFKVRLVKATIKNL